MGRDVLLLSLIGHVVLARSDEVSAIKLKNAAPTILESKFVGRICPFIKLESFERLREKERTEESNRSNRSPPVPLRFGGSTPAIRMTARKKKNPSESPRYIQALSRIVTNKLNIHATFDEKKLNTKTCPIPSTYTRIEKKNKTENIIIRIIEVHNIR